MDDALKQCEEELARLETENQDLRQSATAFGDLAERLNRALREGSHARKAAPTEQDTSSLPPLPMFGSEQER